LRSSRAVAVVLAACLAAAACELEKVEIPRTEKFLALHSVLSASAPNQVVLLERTRNGSVRVVAPSFELESPLGSDTGIAESGAIVTMTTPSGETLVAREDNSTLPGAPGSGVYRFMLPGSALERGGSYRLSVRSRDGELLSAETSVPAGTPALLPDSSVFDRAKDAAVIAWPASAGARSYWVRIESPLGPRSFFTSDTSVRLPGGLRNVDLDELPHLFIPGYPQAVTVSAVDSNFYDWYRTHNDALSGTGLIDRVDGGYGVFGAMVRLRYVKLDVVAPQPEPVAGHFVFAGTDEEAGATPYLELWLYVESAAARTDMPDALSGRARRRQTIFTPGCFYCGVLGSAKQNRVELNFLRGWSARDTAETFTGELRGDTLVGSYRFAGGVAHFVRQ
jgi:hypothetical protein